MTYSPDPAFAALFAGFTGGHAHSIGHVLTHQMIEQGADDPLLVSTASDIVLFPGRGAAPQLESFRKSTRGFIELTAVSHLPLAICYVARMRDLAPAGDDSWRARLQALIGQAQATQLANQERMWREHVALQAFAGQEAKITALVGYTLRHCIDLMQRALAQPALLDFETLRERFLDAGPEHLPVNMNDVMFATFGLAYVDIAFRIMSWLQRQGIDWARAMVLVSGQSGRPTAGVTWSSNNMCNLVWQASDRQLPADRLFVAPHAPSFSIAQLDEGPGLPALETTYRQVWCHTRASIDLSRQMFDGYGAWHFEPNGLQDMPPISGLDDHAACVSRLRRIMEDPQQLLSNCVADYVVAELRRCAMQPDQVRIPGFTDRSFS